MEINFRESGKITLVELSGEIDGKTASQAQEKILPLVKEDCRLVLDLSRVGFMSSAGLRFLLSLRRQMPYGGNLVLTSLPEQIKDTMAITGFLDLFTIFETQSEAVNFLS
ncbi:MAG: anti-sigma-factor antagonist [Chloroflexi bacterium]|jgi:anti-sigma B factor antagonist|nr:anti-sigma-factor antagonist [Chloroflexota bacterium]